MTNPAPSKINGSKKISHRFSTGMAFITTFLYTGLFLFCKFWGFGGALILINIVYAAYAFFTLWLDRKNKFSDVNDARLVTLGTGLAPVAVALIDALLTYQTVIQNSPGWLLFLSGCIVFIIWFGMMLVASAIPAEITNKLKPPARSSNGN